MPIDKAKKHYLGQDGYERLNCAQSIVSAFKEEFAFDKDYLLSFKAYGGGRAPEGQCGAFYAAKTLLSIIEKDRIPDFENDFLEQASSIKCKDIRENKKLSCLGCVEKSSEYVKNIKDKTKKRREIFYYG